MSKVIELTPEQTEAASKAEAYLMPPASMKSLEYRYREPFVITGHAGTGKTTVIKEIMDLTSSRGLKGIVCVYTGKAASVLRRKRVDANTIHSTIYDYDPINEEFHLKENLEGDFIIVDEGSMVPSDLWKDLRSYHLPTIVVGDPGQLEPLGKDPKLLSKPHVVLKTIHRQAEKSEIVSVANAIRCEKKPEFSGSEIERLLPYQWGFEDIDYEFLEDITLKKDGQILCGFNGTRNKVNQAFREYLYPKSPTGSIEVGEKLIVLKNNASLGVFNGMLLKVDKILGETSNEYHIQATSDEGRPYKLYVSKKWLGAQKYEFGNVPRGVTPVDYGYCITLHKFQGSEADNIVLFDEQCDLWSPSRWRYTGITRAAKRLWWFMS